MTIQVHSIEPSEGLARGGEVVRIRGSGFGHRVEVHFGGVLASTILQRPEGAISIVDVRTPPHSSGVVNIFVQRLTLSAHPVPGESVEIPSAFRFLRPRIIEESALTRLVRTLLKQIKRDVLENTSLTVAVDFGVDGVEAIPIARLPALVLTGPRVRPNRFYSSNVPREEVVEVGSAQPELRRRSPAYTADLLFDITGSSRSTVELLNLMAATISFFNRTRWIAMTRSASNPRRGIVRWEMDPEGDVRTVLDGPDDLRAFTYSFIVRGFDVDEGQFFDLGQALLSPPDLRIGAGSEEGRR